LAIKLKLLDYSTLKANSTGNTGGNFSICTASLMKEVKMDFIDDFVALGSWLDAEAVAELKEERVDLVVDARTLFRRKETHRGIGGLFAPLEYEPIVDKVLRMGDLLLAISNHNARMLVHCVWGMDRTPFVSMVYYAKRYSLSYELAYQAIAAKHPQTKYHWDWVKMLGTPTLHSPSSKNCREPNTLITKEVT
jgi:hypothetical protein